MENNQKLEKIDNRLLALDQEKVDLLAQKKRLLDKFLFNEKKQPFYQSEKS